MKRITPLPRHALVPADATERLQEKFRQAKNAAAREQFWMGVQASKQPQYVTTWPHDGTSSLDYDLDPPPV